MKKQRTAQPPSSSAPSSSLRYGGKLLCTKLFSFGRSQCMLNKYAQFNNTLLRPMLLGLCRHWQLAKKTLTTCSSDVFYAALARKVHSDQHRNTGYPFDVLGKYCQIGIASQTA